MSSFNVQYQGVKYCFDLKNYSREQAKSEIESLFIKYKITTPYSQPKSLKLTVYQFKSVNGSLGEQIVDTIDINLPLQRMTDAEFEDEKVKIFRELNINVPEILSFIENKSYEDGHSYGMEEVVSYIRSNGQDLVELFNLLKIDISKKEISLKK